MAKIQLSAMFAGIRGKLNGSVFSVNRAGAYIRTKVTPSNPQTAAQVLARSFMTQLSQAWRSLTEAQRAAWQGAVNDWAGTDVFGNLLNPTGHTLFIKLNIRLFNAGAAQINVPPLQVGADLIILQSIAADSGADELIMTMDTAAVPAGHALQIEATPPMSNGIYNANSKFRRIGKLAAAQLTNQDIGPLYIAKFGAMVSGQKVFVRTLLVNTTTGEQSQATKADTVIV